MKYAKFINEQMIEFAPKNKGSVSNYNLSPKLMTADGYKPLTVVEKVSVEKPNVRYRETDNGIEQFAEASPVPVIPEPTLEQKEAQIRNQRNMLLDLSDWTQLNDSPLTAEQKKEWAEYRQALRDVPAQESFPYKVVFPSMPETETKYDNV